MVDRFGNRAEGFDSPASVGFVVTPHDTNEVQEITRALYVGGGGDLVVEMLGGGEVTLRGVPAGALLALRVRRVKTASTATAIVGLV